MRAIALAGCRQTPRSHRRPLRPAAGSSGGCRCGTLAPAVGAWQRFLAPYYWATPLFVLLDVAWGLNVRVAGLDDYPGLRYGYYAFCLACAVVIRLLPQGTTAVAMLESGANLSLLVGGFFMTYAGVIGQIGSGQAVRNPFTPRWFVNFLLSGTVALVAYHRAEYRNVLERAREEVLARRRRRR